MSNEQQFNSGEAQGIPDICSLSYDVSKSLPQQEKGYVGLGGMIEVKSKKDLCKHGAHETVNKDFIVKDSGKRQEFTSGMQRDTTDGKIDYTLITDGPMLKRWAEHLTKGAKKYAKRNWMRANGQDELERFKESAFRHFMQWFHGETDEDHASAVYFNVNGYEFCKGKLNDGMPDKADGQ